MISFLGNDSGNGFLRSFRLYQQVDELFTTAFKRIPDKYKGRFKNAMAKITTKQQEEVIDLINSIPGSRVLEDHHWIRQVAIERFPAVNDALKAHNIDLFEWQENLSLIVGHKSRHLGSYAEMVDEQMLILEDMILNNKIPPEELIEEIKDIILDIKNSVKDKYMQLNNYKIIVLD